MSGPTPTEEAAILSLWQKEGHSAEDPVPEDERGRLLTAVRLRARAIEHEALEMLNSRLREGRRFPRRHMQFAFAALILGGGAIALLIWIIEAVF